jgi:ABC-2 type transport system ATP-binding protein
MIRIRDLYKYYGTQRAVGPLSAQIEQGEVVGLLGLNGAGKTTTLRILACDLLPSAGSVEVDGVDVVEHPDRVRAMIGYLPDVPPVYEDMSVERFLRFAAELRGVSTANLDGFVNSALKETALLGVASSRISSLSHGYRQRVGIAQAIVHQPKLVILDEPSGGLDPVQIKEMRKLVRGIAGQRTVLVSSHNLPEISEMCDRLFVIGEGKIVAAGTEAELISELLRGERLELTACAGPDGEAALLGSLRALSGVTEIQPMQVVDTRADAVSFLISCDKDLRAEVARSIVQGGHELLSLGRSRHELENVFSKLATGHGTSKTAVAESEVPSKTEAA